MHTRFEAWGYELCWRGDWISDLFSRIWFRFYCPYPIIKDHSVRACIVSGNCGCDNNPIHRGKKWNPSNPKSNA